jgi:hypothetical protein
MACLRAAAEHGGNLPWWGSLGAAGEQRASAACNFMRPRHLGARLLFVSDVAGQQCPMVIDELACTANVEVDSILLLAPPQTVASVRRHP